MRCSFFDRRAQPNQSVPSPNRVLKRFSRLLRLRSAAHGDSKYSQTSNGAQTVDMRPVKNERYPLYSLLAPTWLKSERIPQSLAPQAIKRPGLLLVVIIAWCLLSTSVVEQLLRTLIMQRSRTFFPTLRSCIDLYYHY